MQPTLITRQISQRPRPKPVVPTATIGLALFGVVLLALAFALFSGPGCASTPQGLARWDRFYQGATNDLAKVGPIATQVTPPPWNAVVEAGLALVSAALTTWNVQQHRRLAALEAAATPATPNAPTRGSP